MYLISTRVISLYPERSKGARELPKESRKITSLLPVVTSGFVMVTRGVGPPTKMS